MELTWQAWFTVAVVLGMFGALLFTKIRTDAAFLLTMIALFISGVLDAKTTFGGFSSESVVLVGVLYVVIAGLTRTGVLDWIVKNLMGMPKSLSGAIARLMIPVAFLSALLSNTTVVALFINVVKKWAKKLNVAPSKLLIPLSYASGLGGVCTLIGTPPNLIISGMYMEDTGVQLSILTTTVCGLFCLAVGVISMIALQKLLPSHKSILDNVDAEELVAELNVPATCPYIGNTIQDLKEEETHKYEVEILAIRRFDNELVTPVTDDEFIMGGDRIIASGTTKAFLRFAHHYNMKSVLLSVLEEKNESANRTGKFTLLSSLIMIAMVAVSALGYLSMLQAALLAALAMVVTRCCTSSQAINSIDWNIIIVFAGSVAIGNAIEDTGIAQVIANGLLDICGTNPYIVLFMVCLVGTFITEFISNTAAGAMFYPIAMTAATSLGVNPLTFCIALMISVSSSFATPIGSPTHMLVYTPGGYTFGDFAKVGLIMNVIILIANIFITTLVFPF